MINPNDIIQLIMENRSMKVKIQITIIIQLKLISEIPGTHWDEIKGDIPEGFDSSGDIAAVSTRQIRLQGSGEDLVNSTRTVESAVRDSVTNSTCDQILFH